MNNLIHLPLTRGGSGFLRFSKPLLYHKELPLGKLMMNTEGGYRNTSQAEMLNETDQNAISILNPKLSNWYFNKISTTTCEGINRWKKYKIEQFPIKSISQSTKFFVEKVDETQPRPHCDTLLKPKSTKWYLPSTASPTKT
ncbi:MAG: hypothetical protein IPH28_05995 [Cytophagaceae bacterium]|nr:hypothetical protein [Cytophagaceae bacterium]